MVSSVVAEVYKSTDIHNTTVLKVYSKGEFGCHGSIQEWYPTQPKVRGGLHKRLYLS